MNLDAIWITIRIKCTLYFIDTIEVIDKALNGRLSLEYYIAACEM